MNVSNRILTSANAPLTVTSAGLGAGTLGTSTFDGLPLTTLDGTATGAIAVRTTGGSGASSSTIQGTAADDAATVGNPVFVGGTAVTAATYTGAYTDGDVVSLKMDKTSGGILAHIRKLTQVDDTVSVVSTSSSSQMTARLVSAAATTNATSVKVTSGVVCKITLYNAAATARYLKLYNLAAAPTVGTSTPVWTEYLPATSKVTLDFPQPLRFGTGIAYALTTGSADSDTGALTLADVLALNIEYV